MPFPKAGKALFSLISPFCYTGGSMKSARREYILIAAFIMCGIFTYAMRAYMGIAADTQKAAQILLWNVAGTLAGALILPLLLPLSYLRYGDLQGHRQKGTSGPFRYGIRLVLTALLFFPGTIMRFLVPEALYLGSRGISAFASFGNGAEFALITGCFYSLLKTKRTLWAVMSTIAGVFVFYLIQGGNFPLPALFTVIGLVSVIGGFLILFFLAGYRPDNVENREGGIGNEVPEVIERRQGSMPAQIEGSRQSLLSSFSFQIPAFIYPLLAVLVIFFTSNITDRLFTPSHNYPFDSGFNTFVVSVLLILALFGFLAARKWELFLRFFVFLCTGLFVISPSLLFFNRSETIFMVLYTLNITATRMITAVFPFVIVDLYWQDISSKSDKPLRGSLAWFLAVSVYSIYLASLVLGTLSRNIQIDSAHAVLVLSLAALVFFILCLKVLPKNTEDSSLQQNVSGPSIDDILREHNLSERETEVALLIVREGLSNEETGERLFISIPTVKSHVSQIYRKLGVKNRAAFLVKVMSGEQ